MRRLARAERHRAPGGTPRPRTRFLTTCAAFVLIVSAAPLAAQQDVVAGVVVDAQTNRALPGVQVAVEGTNQGAVTDAAGRFRIEGLSGGEVTLRVVMLGYQELTRPVRVGNTSVQLSLSQSAIELDNIVVTGTVGGTQKRALGTTVGEVNAAQITEVSPAADVQQLLGGRVPGVVVLPGSGNVGTGSATRVRGISSISLSNEPLIYIDGVRVNNDASAGPNIRQGRQVNRLNDINLDDIERIEVIKGPAAATLYGTEASNGVIQIITKRGQTGAATFDMSVRQGATWLMDPEGKVPTVYSTDAVTGEVVGVNLYENELAAGREVFQTGHNQSYDLSLSGGTDVLRYYLSAEWGRDEGIVDYNWQNEMGARANLSIVPTDQIDIQANFDYMQSETRFAQAASGWGIWDQLVWGSPAQLDTRTRGFLRATPEAAGEIDSRASLSRFVGGVTINHRPTTWLNHRLIAGIDNSEDDNQILFPRHPDGANYFFGSSSLGERTIERNNALFYTVDYAATARYNPSERLSFATSGGVQYFIKQFDNVDALGRFFPAPAVTEISGAAQTFSSEETLENRTLGLFIQEEISLNNRVFLTGAVRGDDNSAFGESFDFVVYPKLSGSWVISEEPFWNFAFVDQLKLRGAWGKAGQQPDVFAAIRLYDPEAGPNDASVVTPLTIGNPDLKPEVGQEVELGFDAALLSDRLSLAFTWYDRKTTDAIVEKNVAPSSGFPGSQFVNIGELSASGIELNVEGHIVDRPSFGWNLGFSIATNESEVVSTGGLGPISFDDQQHREGYPIAAFFMRRVISAELDPDGTAINVLCDSGPGNGNAPVDCNEAPPVYVGVPNPTWEGSVYSDVTLLGGLRLNALVEFRGGHRISNGDIEASHHTFRNSRAINEQTNPLLLGADQVGAGQTSGLYDAGFAKLREVSASYTLPDRIVSLVGAARGSLNVAARNLATLWRAQDEIFGHPIPDSEVRTPGSNLSGYVQTVIPPLSTFEATLRLSF